MQDHTAYFFKQLADGKLCLQYCQLCNEYVFYPRRLCPNCFCSDLIWKKTAGLGKVYSYTMINYSNLPGKCQQVPYIYAIVELEEGIRLATNITECLPEDVFIGMPVELALKEDQEDLLHYFRPVKSAT